MHHLKQILAVGLCALWPAMSQADSLWYDYFTLLGPVDAFNSRGVPLDDICTIAQQDRANWHRFNKREMSDGPDEFFTSTDRRALFADRCVADRGYYANAGPRIRSGERAFYVYVRVFGENGRVTRIVVAEGAG